MKFNLNSWSESHTERKWSATGKREAASEQASTQLILEQHTTTRWCAISCKARKGRERDYLQSSSKYAIWLQTQRQQTGHHQGSHKWDYLCYPCSASTQITAPSTNATSYSQLAKCQNLRPALLSQFFAIHKLEMVTRVKVNHNLLPKWPCPQQEI